MGKRLCVTVWGAEYDSLPAISAAPYFSDSDDMDEYGMHRIPCGE